MKKIRDAERYKRRQRRKLRRYLRGRRKSAARMRRVSTQPQYRLPAELAVPRERPAERYRGYERVFAPSALSMISNPEQSAEFFARLVKNLGASRKTFVKLIDVERISYEAILVLFAIMIRYKAAGVGFSGDYPSNAQANAVLRASGFFEALYKQEFVSQDRYVVQGKQRLISTHADKCVDSALSARIIEEATKGVWGDTVRSQGTQRVLLELMLNTNNHASPRQQGAKHWWLFVNQEPDERAAAFSFVDFGVGIPKSLFRKGTFGRFAAIKERVLPWLEGKSNVDILRQIMSGEFHRTVAGQEHRGKGLPGIAQAFRRGWLSNLVIISNDVYVHLGRDEYRTFQPPFDGTLVCWELHDTNRHTTEI